MSAEVIAALVIGSIALFLATAGLARRSARRKRGSSVQIAAISPATIAPYFVWVPYAVVALRPGPNVDLPDLIRVIGLFVTIGGVAFAIWSIATMGRHYDLELEVHEGHEIVRTGPYGIVRHPIYLGLAAHLIGACLATGSVILALGTLVVAIPALYLRAATEERLLRSQFGPAYAAYARDVPMLVPRPRQLRQEE